MGAEAAARSRREALHLGVTAEIAEHKQELKGGVRCRQTEITKRYMYSNTHATGGEEKACQKPCAGEILSSAIR